MNAEKNEQHKTSSSQNFYNIIASSYNHYCKTSGVKKDVADQIILLQSFSPKTVLEFGVGTGRFARMFVAYNKQVIYTGVDNSEEMLSQARDICATLVLSDFSHYLDTAIACKQTFDVIIAPYTEIHHIHTKDQLALLKKMKKVTRTVIINCLTEEAEQVLFANNTITQEVTFSLSLTSKATTEVHRLSSELRKAGAPYNKNKERMNLVFTSP